MKIRAPFRIVRHRTQYGPYLFVQAFSIVRTVYLTAAKTVSSMMFRWDYRYTDTTMAAPKKA